MFPGPRCFAYLFVLGAFIVRGLQPQGAPIPGVNAPSCGDVDAIITSERDTHRPDTRRIGTLMQLSYPCDRAEVRAELVRELRSHSSESSWGEGIFQAAEAALAANDFAVAESLLHLIENTYPEQGSVWASLGAVQLETGRYGQAEQSYLRAAKVDAQSPEIQLGLAGAHALSGHGELGLETLERDIQRFASDPSFLIAYADLLQHLPAYSDAVFRSRAEGYLRHAIALDDTSARAHYLLAQLLIVRAQMDEAVRELQIALQYQPEFREAHFALARACRRLGRKADAERQYAIFQQLEKRQGPEQQR